MNSTSIYSAYDPFAKILNEAWGPQVNELLSDIETLLLKHLPQQAHILDLCCGSGHLAQKLIQKNYQVTGIDGSEKLLQYARQNASDAKFILEDARYFQLPESFDGVISTKYGLNHIISLEELSRVFENVYNALVKNGLFMFDLRLEQLYKSVWNNSMEGNVTEDYAWALKRNYNSQENIGSIHITVFEAVNENWQRYDTTWLVKGYSQAPIISALKSVGFKKIKCYNAQDILAATEDAPVVYFVCTK